MLFELKRRSYTVVQAGLICALLAVTAFGAAVGALGVLAVVAGVGACVLAAVVWDSTSGPPGEVLFGDDGFIVRTVAFGRERRSRIPYGAIESVEPRGDSGPVAITYRGPDSRRKAVIWPVRPAEFAGEVEWRRSFARRAA